ncbi:MAG: ABC transporter permease [Erysipelotrichales bacterium]|nr:ABC transporter permease [Erysipelotrichales bacterium]
MECFRILLNFTLTRRIWNKTFVIVNLLLSLLIALLFCVDMYIPLFFQLDYKPTITCSDGSVCDGLESILPNFRYIEEEKERESEHYHIECSDTYDIMVEGEYQEISLTQLELGLKQWQEITLIQEGILTFKPVYIHYMQEEEDSADTWGFLCITAVYFLALSFAGSVANDIVYEKATRMMELILSSADASVHLLAKLFGGWLVLLFQLGIFLIDIVVCSVIRYIYDRGKGLVELLVELGLVQEIYDITLSSIGEWITHNTDMIGYLCLALVIMLLGILLVQSVLVILSSFISNIEEAGNIQSPFYLLLMGVYYLTIFVNTKESMTNGLGRILSLLPFFSMLCMPCRIFYHSLPPLDIVISLGSAIGALVFVVVLGTPIYKIGILDYSDKSIKDKLMKPLLSSIKE